MNFQALNVDTRRSIEETQISFVKDGAQGQNLAIVVNTVASESLANRDPESKVHSSWTHTGVNKYRPSGRREKVIFDVPPAEKPSPLAKKGIYFGEDIMDSYSNAATPSVHTVVKHVWPTDQAPAEIPPLQDIKGRLAKIQKMIIDKDVRGLLETRVGSDMLMAYGQLNSVEILNPEVLFAKTVYEGHTDSATMNRYIKDPKTYGKKHADIDPTAPQSPRINIGGELYQGYKSAATETERQAAIKKILYDTVGAVQDWFFISHCKEFQLFKSVIASYEKVVEEAITAEKEAAQVAE